MQHFFMTKAHRSSTIRVDPLSKHCRGTLCFKNQHIRLKTLGDAFRGL